MHQATRNSERNYGVFIFEIKHISAIVKSEIMGSVPIYCEKGAVPVL